MTGGRAGETIVHRALRGHAALGLLAAALLYVVALSGSLVVIADTWGRWEQPQVPEMTALAPGAAQAAMTAALAHYTTLLAQDGAGPPSRNLTLRLPTPSFPRATVTTERGSWYVDAAGRLAARDDAGWTRFVVELHERLHLPGVWGLLLLGSVGVALVALAVTGVLAHPRIVRDAFRLRARHGSVLAWIDWHNRLGVWTLPFVLAVATTGAFLSLSSVGAGLLARVHAGGEVARIYAPVFGPQVVADGTAAALPDLAAALHAVAVRAPDVRPTYLFVQGLGTRGQDVRVSAEQPRRLIYGETYLLGPRGEWRGKVGLSDGAAGQQAAASVYNLHFGNYGGPAVQVAYLLFGLALCVVTATGTSIWLSRREQRRGGGARLRAGWAVVVWGTPLALVLLVWVRALAGPEAPFAAAFWCSLAAGLSLAIARPGWAMRRTLCGATLTALAATALLHLLLLRPTTAGPLAIDAGALIVALIAARGTLRPGGD